MDYLGGCEGGEVLMNVIIVILLLFLIWKLGKLEHLASNRSYIGHGLPYQVYDSGADQRFASQFTSTDQ